VIETPVVVRASNCQRKPLALYEHDGNRKAPKGGILLFAEGEVKPSIFPSARAAQLAIHRTIQHRATMKMEDNPDNYEIQNQDAFYADMEAILNPKKRRGKK
jgi:hypothetical protein